MIARLLCWLSGGHDDQIVRTPHRRMVRLRCSDCGRETAGWFIDGREPIVTQHGDVMRHVLLNPRLMKRPGPAWWLRAVHSKRGA